MNPEAQEAILAQLDANGGRMAWTALIEALPYELRQHVPDAVRALKKQGIAQKQNRVLPDGGIVFEVFRIQAQGGE